MIQNTVICWISCIKLPALVKANSMAQGVLSQVLLPMIDELYAMLNGSNVYSSLESTSGYHHIALLPEAKQKSAFLTLICKFEYKKVPFSLAQALAHFKKLINEVFKGFPFTFGYLDDSLYFIENFDKHFKHLRTVFGRLRKANIKLRWKKYHYFKHQLHYLGDTISEKRYISIIWKVLKYWTSSCAKTAKEVR